MKKVFLFCVRDSLRKVLIFEANVILVCVRFIESVLISCNPIQKNHDSELALKKEGFLEKNKKAHPVDNIYNKNIFQCFNLLNLFSTLRVEIRLFSN